MNALNKTMVSWIKRQVIAHQMIDHLSNNDFFWYIGG